MFQLDNCSNEQSFKEILNKMHELFGDQDHFSLNIFLESSKRFPNFTQSTHHLKKEHQSGHICYIPFNHKGYLKMTSADFSEKDLDLDDLFDLKKDDRMYLFVYSIFSNHSKLTKKMIEKTVLACRELPIDIVQRSKVFAEIVSRDGERIATSMGFSKAFQYQFQNETMIIFECPMLKYIQSFVH